MSINLEGMYDELKKLKEAEDDKYRAREEQKTELEAKYRELESNSTARIQNLEQTVSNQQRDLGEKDSEIKRMRVESEAHEARAASLASELAEVKAQMDRLNGSYVAVFSELLSEKKEQQQEIGRLKEENGKLIAEQAEVVEASAELKAQLEVCKKVIESLKEENEKQVSHLIAKKHEVYRSTKANTEVETQLEACKLDLHNQKLEIKSLNIKLARTSEAQGVVITELFSLKTEQQKEIERLKEENGKLVAQLEANAELEAKNGKLESQLDTQQNEMQKLSAQLETCKLELNSQKQEIESLNITLTKSTEAHESALNELHSQKTEQQEENKKLVSQLTAKQYGVYRLMEVNAELEDQHKKLVIQLKAEQDKVRMVEAQMERCKLYSGKELADSLGQLNAKQNKMQKLEDQLKAANQDIKELQKASNEEYERYKKDKMDLMNQLSNYQNRTIDGNRKRRCDGVIEKSVSSVEVQVDIMDLAELTAEQAQFKVIYEWAFKYLVSLRNAHLAKIEELEEELCTEKSKNDRTIDGNRKRRCDGVIKKSVSSVEVQVDIMDLAELNVETAELKEAYEWAFTWLLAQRKERLAKIEKLEEELRTEKSKNGSQNDKTVLLKAEEAEGDMSFEERFKNLIDEVNSNYRNLSSEMKKDVGI